MVSFVTDQPVQFAGGQTVINRGPTVVFYGPTSAVSPTSAAGSVAPGASYVLSGATWFVSAKRGAVSTVSSGADYGPPQPAQSGSAALAPVAPSIKPPTRVFTRAQSGHGMTGGADEVSSSFLFGRAYKVTTNGAGGSLYVGPPAFTAYDMSGKTFRVRVRVDDPTRINAFELYVTTGSGNVFKTSLPQNLVAGESAWITIPRATASGTLGGTWSVASGTPAWTGVTQLQVRFQDKSTGAINAHIEAIEAIAEDTAYPNGVMCVCLHDGYDGQIANGVPPLDARGIPATFFPIIDAMEPFGWTKAYLQSRVARAGWSVGVHAYAKTVHDYGLPAQGTVPAETAVADWKRAQAWLNENGMPSGAQVFAMNPGTGSPVPEGAMLDALRANFAAALTNSGFTETQRPADPHRFRSILFTGNSNAQLQANIDQACAQGGVFALALHEIIPGSTNGTAWTLPAMAANNLGTVLDYAIGKGMAFRTVPDMLDGR